MPATTYLLCAVEFAERASYYGCNVCHSDWTPEADIMLTLWYSKCTRTSFVASYPREETELVLLLAVPKTLLVHLAKVVSLPPR